MNLRGYNKLEKNSKWVNVDLDKFKWLYLEERLPSRVIQEKLGISEKVFTKRRKYLGLPLRPRMSLKQRRTRKKVYTLPLDKIAELTKAGFTYKEIAKKINLTCNPTSIGVHLREHYEKYNDLKPYLKINRLNDNNWGSYSERGNKRENIVKKILKDDGYKIYKIQRCPRQIKDKLIKILGEYIFLPDMIVEKEGRFVIIEVKSGGKQMCRVNFHGRQFVCYQRLIQAGIPVMFYIFDKDDSMEKHEFNCNN